MLAASFADFTKQSGALVSRERRKESSHLGKSVKLFSVLVDFTQQPHGAHASLCISQAMPYACIFELVLCLSCANLCYFVALILAEVGLFSCKTVRGKQSQRKLKNLCWNVSEPHTNRPRHIHKHFWKKKLGYFTNISVKCPSILASIWYRIHIGVTPICEGNAHICASLWNRTWALLMNSKQTYIHKIPQQYAKNTKKA